MSDFSKVTELPILSGRLSISDSSYFFDFPLVVVVPAGLYAVELAHVVVDGHKIVERLRLVDGRGREQRGQLLGYVQTEFAQLGLCDRAAMEMAYASASDTEIEHFTSQFALSSLFGLARLSSEATMILVKPGLGDLEPAIYELVRNGARAGIEAVFVEPEARLPG